MLKQNAKQNMPGSWIQSFLVLYLVKLSHFIGRENEM